MFTEIEKRALEKWSKDLNKSKLSIAFMILKNFIYELISSYCPIHSQRVKYHRKRGIQIGNDTYIGREIVFDRIHPELISVGNHSCIGERCFITSHQGFPMNNPLKILYPVEIKPVNICDNVMIYPNVSIIAGITIYDYSIVGLGSVVVKDVLPMTVVAGVPAKLIKDISEEVKMLIPQHEFERLMEIRKEFEIK